MTKGNSPEPRGRAEADKADGSRNPELVPVPVPMPVPDVPLKGVGGGNIILPGPPISGVSPLKSVADPGPDIFVRSWCCRDDNDCDW
jgi:hypothetical protein